MNRIVISNGNWGTGSTRDIHRLLVNVASHIERWLDCKSEYKILVQNAAPEVAPRILYRTNQSGPITILLSTRERRWDQYSYQFAHEFCHLVSDYENLRKQQKQWFQEVLCELASLFVLKQMAAEWRTNPPYSNWDSYAPSLQTYAHNAILAAGPAPTSGKFGNWYRINQLRTNPYNRQLNCLVATALLPFIELQPRLLNGVTNLPDSDSCFLDFLRQWRARCVSNSDAFVERVIELFEMAD